VRGDLTGSFPSRYLHSQVTGHPHPAACSGSPIANLIWEVEVYSDSTSVIAVERMNCYLPPTLFSTTIEPYSSFTVTTAAVAIGLICFVMDCHPWNSIYRGLNAAGIVVVEMDSFQSANSRSSCQWQPSWLSWNSLSYPLSSISKWLFGIQ
jgi:hypothetical protein